MGASRPEAVLALLAERSERGAARKGMGSPIVAACMAEKGYRKVYRARTELW
jgi:hypothetical protein